MKKLFIFLLVLLPITARADASGTCGTNLTYVYESATGTLTITGNGNMGNYDSYSSQPWYSYRSEIKEIIIGNGVTSIGSYAFYGCSSLASIAIPNSVTSIGTYAFRNCKSMKTIKIGNGVKSIGYYAFQDCSGLTSVYISDLAAWCKISFGVYDSNPLYYAHHLYLNDKEIKNLEIPSSVTSIRENAFYNCSGMTSVSIPSSVTSIGRNAFCGCSGLTSVSIPSSVTSIGSSAFSDCSGLSSVTIPSNVTRIENSVFYGCKKLTYINLSSSLTSLDDYAFYGCTSLTSIYIPNSVTSIGSRVFKNCSSMKTVTIGNSVKYIGEETFYGCSSLTSTTIPNSVTSIGGSAFKNCTSLKTVTIGNGVKYLGKETFYGCISLTSINIPNSVTSIGSSAFYGCTSLKSIIIPNSVTSIGSSAFSGCSTLLSVYIPNSVTSIGSSAFSGCSCLPIINNIRYADTYLIEVLDNSLSEYQIKEGTRFIGHGAFNGCSRLTSINIPNSVINIGHFAFMNCTSLKAVAISNSVTNIDSYAFQNCSSLNTVKIGSGVKSIGDRAFEGCSSLTSVEIHCKEIKTWFAGLKSIKNITIGDEVTSIGSSAFNGLTALDTIIFGDSVSSIGDRSFSGCSSLTSVILPNSLTEIGLQAFEYCSSLTSVTFGSNVTSIGYGVVDHCDSIVAIKLRNPIPIKINSFRFPDRHKITLYVPVGSKESYLKASIWNEFKEIIEYSDIILFADIKVKSLCLTNWDANKDGELHVMEAADVATLGTVFQKSQISSFNELQYFTGLTEINEGVFSGSTVKELTLPKNIISIKKNAFLSCKSLTSLHLPAKVKEVGLNALSGCTAMSSITVDEDNQNFCDIDGVLFSKDKNVLLQFPAAKSTSYILPDGTTSIARDAFYMSNLESVELPSSLNELGYDAFGWSRQLTELVIPEGVTVIGDYILDGCTSLTSLHIPASATSIGEHICNGCKAITDIWSYSKKPFAINDNNYTTTVYSNATLHVPYGYKDAYAGTDGWKNFAHIVDDMAASTLSAADLTINLGYTCDLFVRLSNNKEIGGVQFDLTLPAGISIATNQDGKHVVETTERSNQLYTDIEKVGDNLYRIILMSTNRATIAPGEGNIIKIRLTCVQNAIPDTYDMAFTSVSLSRQEGNVSVNEFHEDYASKLIVNKASRILGDANGDYEVNITDVLVIVDYILGRPNKRFLFSNADYDKDNDVNITDALNVVNYILGRITSDPPRAARKSEHDLLRMESGERGCQFFTAIGIPNITALQMDVVLPIDCRLQAATLSGKESRTHQMMVRQLEDNRYRIVVFSSKKELLDTDAAILNLDIEGRGGMVCAEHIQCFDEQNIPILSPDLSAVMTGIRPIFADGDDNVPAYNISGQRVAKTQRGIKIVNGRKVVVR